MNTEAHGKNTNTGGLSSNNWRKHRIHKPQISVFTKTRLSSTHGFSCVKAQIGVQQFSGDTSAWTCFVQEPFLCFLLQCQFLYILGLIFNSSFGDSQEQRKRDKALKSGCGFSPFTLHTSFWAASCSTWKAQSTFSVKNWFLDQVAGADLMSKANFSARDPVLLVFFLI